MASNPVNAWFRKLREGLEDRNQNRLAIKCGPTGSGKSWGSLTTAEVTMGEDFNPEKNIAYFDPIDFVTKVRKAKKKDVVIFDEAGVGIDSRRWASASNIIVTQIMQSFRTRNLFVLFTTPDFSFVDVKARKLFHNFVEMDRRPQNNPKAPNKGLWWELYTKSFTGEMRRKPQKIQYQGKLMPLSKIEYVKPSEWLTEPYENHRAKALDKLFDKAQLHVVGDAKTVTVNQACALMNFQEKPVIYNLMAKGLIPMEQDTRHLKVPLSWVKGIVKKLKIYPYDELTLHIGDLKDMSENKNKNYVELGTDNAGKEHYLFVKSNLRRQSSQSVAN